MEWESLHPKKLTAWKKAHTAACLGPVTPSMAVSPGGKSLTWAYEQAYEQMMQNQPSLYASYGIASSQQMLNFDFAQTEQKLASLLFSPFTLYGVGDDNLPVELDNSKKWALPVGEEGASASETGGLQHESATGEPA